LTIANRGVLINCICTYRYTLKSGYDAIRVVLPCVLLYGLKIVIRIRNPDPGSDTGVRKAENGERKMKTFPPPFYNLKEKK
jgi:hypothetical protein